MLGGRCRHVLDLTEQHLEGNDINFQFIRKRYIWDFFLSAFSVMMPQKQETFKNNAIA